MDIGQEELVKEFESKPWFHSVSKDEYGRHVVYVKYMCHETLHSIPDKLAGKQVLVHFAAYLEADLKKYTNILNVSSAPSVPLEAESNEEKEIEFLEMELFLLKRTCGQDNLIDILYELHEDRTGNKLLLGLTDYSKEFPDVRKRMEKLYDKWGCDVLFGQLDVEE